MMVQSGTSPIRKLDLSQRDRVLWWRTVMKHFRHFMSMMETFSSAGDEEVIRSRIRYLQGMYQAVQRVPCPAAADELYTNLTKSILALRVAYEAALRLDWQESEIQYGRAVVSVIALQTVLLNHNIAWE